MTTERKYVDVNGAQVMDLTPDLDRPLALVDLDVLIKLTSNLGRANAYKIQRDLISDIRNVDTTSRDDSKESLQELVHICSEFMAFHRTVNLIQEINKPDNVEPPKVIGKISKADLDDMGI